ncbi:MAG: SDR family NAD(P)-dependent oxidoreductase [Pseudomonadota bacterium]
MPTTASGGAAFFDLDGHVALVTGGNGGIGLAFARGLVKAGARVALWGRNADKNAAAVRDLEALGGDVAAFVCDVVDRRQVEQAFAATLERFGLVDSVFANAGASGKSGMLHQLGADDWQWIVDTNLGSVVNTYQVAIDHLLARKAGGKLVVTSSAAALLGTGYRSGYSTTKAAVMGLTRALAVELGPHGIQVNAVLPGYVETDITVDTPQAFKDACLRRSCIGRVGTLDDMEGVAVFLASRQSDYMTGQGLVLDGGQTIYPL